MPPEVTVLPRDCTIRGVGLSNVGTEFDTLYFDDGPSTR